MARVAHAFPHGERVSVGQNEAYGAEHIWCVREHVVDGGECDRSCALVGKGQRSRRQRWKRDRSSADLARGVERLSVDVREERVFVMRAPPEARRDRMNDVLRWEKKTRGDDDVARSAASALRTDLGECGLQFAAGCTANCTFDDVTRFQRRVRRTDDRVDVLRRDVAHDEQGAIDTRSIGRGRSNVDDGPCREQIDLALVVTGAGDFHTIPDVVSRGFEFPA